MTGIKIYVGIWLGLVIATVLEVVIRSLPGSAQLIVLVIGVIAGAKAIVIALYYQHLRYEGIRLASLPLAAIVGVVFLGVSAAFTLAMGM